MSVEEPTLVDVLEAVRDAKLDIRSVGMSDGISHETALDIIAAGRKQRDAARDRLRRILASWDFDRVENTMRCGMAMCAEMDDLRKELEAAE